MSERGPKGDHGQHGDKGTAGVKGDTGVPGAPGAPGTPGAAGGVGERGRQGDTGDEGERGREGRRGRSNWQAYVMMGLAMIAALTVFLLLDEKRQNDAAKTALSNCQQIEVVKEQIRGTVSESLGRLPTLAYYKRNPGELQDALNSARASVERFKPIDCYSLPAVASEVERPR